MSTIQEIDYFETPSPHIIIDNFLSKKMADAVLKEFIRLEPQYKPARSSAHDDLRDDDCDECKKRSSFLNKANRVNDVIYLDSYYNKRRTSSSILEAIQYIILQNEPTIKFISSVGGMFEIINQVNTSETTLSRYGMCDFYGWHKDQFGAKYISSRIITLIYYVNTEPQKFEGGELLIAGKDISDIKKVEPKHNRAVVFLSKYTLHAVNSVKHNGEFKDSRFSINCWLGFDGPWKFR